MAKEQERGKNVRKYIMLELGLAPKTIVKKVTEEFGLSRQAAHYHVNKLVNSGEIFKKGERKSAAYFLSRQSLLNKVFPIEGLEEDIVWSDFVSSKIDYLPENVKSICHYGFTEMLNNAIDHSESGKVRVVLEKSGVDIRIQIIDFGEGIFKRICRLKNLMHEPEAVFELSKGKLTTDPTKHTGEGIFFSSRMFDLYYIWSGGLVFSHAINSDSDWVQEVADSPGTRVSMTISNRCTRTDEEIFDTYADPEIDPSFHKTVIPVKLAQYQGDGLVSRSQAKRIMRRIDKFKTVILDFTDVSKIGQGFADEIFRVFVAANPDIKVSTANVNSRVEKMIQRVVDPE